MSGSTPARRTPSWWRSASTSPGRPPLYLEGSDQHRGWFQSSLLEACGTRGRAPYDAVRDARLRARRGRAQDVEIARQCRGAAGRDPPIGRGDPAAVGHELRLRRGPAHRPRHHQGQCRILSQAPQHAPLLLGNLAHYQARSCRAVCRDAGARALHARAARRARTMPCAKAMRSSTSSASSTRCSISASTTCRPSISTSARTRSIAIHTIQPTRRAALTVLDRLFLALTAWLAPMLCFTMEEAWLNRFPNDKGSVHLRQFPEVPREWRDEALAEKWRKVRALRRVVTGALEIERKEGRIGSSLEAAPKVYVADDDHARGAARRRSRRDRHHQRS